jgi:peptidoglycan/xylan/chitin deacetylase (PgdA/CDA1 family)
MLTREQDAAHVGTMRPRILVTTSWDDGVQQDVRLAEMLAERGMSGTFYVCGQPREASPLASTGLRQLRSMGMEIGAHTLTHPNLTHLSPSTMRSEIEESKDRLEDTLGEPVPSFCYPYGAHSPAVVDCVAACGFSLARTTMGFRDELEFHPLAAPVGVQVYAHSRPAHVRHALKEGNVTGLLRWLLKCGSGMDPVQLTRALASDVERGGGILHIWGHSWEIDRLDMWSMLATMLDVLSAVPSAEYVDNHGLLRSRVRGAAHAG